MEWTDLRAKLKQAQAELDESRSTIVHVGCDKDCARLRKENWKLRLQIGVHQYVPWACLIVVIWILKG